MKYIFILFISSILSNAQVKIDNLNLMPWPQNISLNGDVFALTKSFKINISGNPNARIFTRATEFLRRLDGRTGLFFDQGFLTKVNEYPSAQLQINCLSNGKIELNEDESYQLEIKSNRIILSAQSDLGVLHGLETLLQMLQNDSATFYFPTATISDFPRFAWRGLMIDVARHFEPLDVLKRNLDAMAAMKMNVFHWHLSDDQGWRIEIKKHPRLTEVASDGNFYTQEEIKSIVKYADERGILVVPEIDVPGHASAILTAFPEIGSKIETEKYPYTIERNAGIFTPTLDPTNPKTYQLLSEILDEVCPLFPGNYFHIGGDENEGKDWDSNPKIQVFKKENSLESNHDLQTYFYMKLIPMLKKHQKELMGWEEIMTKDMPKEAIIHIWKETKEEFPSEQSIVKAVKNGYKVVLSKGFYIDLMLGMDTHYKNDPIPKNANLTSEEKKRILGGEATMWSELVTPSTIDSRIWPRTAAIAERLWSNENITDLASLRKRMKNISFRLEELGITHLRNKAVLLRNISNNQAYTALEEFSNICEPLKVYTRNIDGTEYKMYSPLTLFADVCTSDASDALDFDLTVNAYIANKNKKNQLSVTNYLKKWILMNQNLVKLGSNAPLVQPILPLSKSLSDLAQQILFSMEKKQALKPKGLNALLEKCNSKKHADVELAVYNSLKKLISEPEKNNKLQLKF